jgi:hypothetical protein
MVHSIVEGEVPAHEPGGCTGVVATMDERAPASEPRQPNDFIDRATGRIRRIGKDVLGAVRNQDQVAGLEVHRLIQPNDANPGASADHEVETGYTRAGWNAESPWPAELSREVEGALEANRAKDVAENVHGINIVYSSVSTIAL